MKLKNTCYQTFLVCKSIRLGCPISALLYTLIVEPLRAEFDRVVP